jgi:ribonucleotide reductase alpha subunit
MNKEWYWLNSDSRLFLERGYLSKDEAAEDRFSDIAKNAEKILGIKGFAKKFLDYLSRGFYSLSTPVITNFGKKKGLPVSCFNSYVGDKMESILSKVAEVGTMSKGGGGTSGFFGDLRPRGAPISVGGESSGPVHFMEIFDKIADVISQGSSRRGSFAAYLPVEHPDIEEFLRIRSEGHEIQNMSIGITVSDDWMTAMRDGDKDKRRLWGLIIKKRFETGYPYIHFTDTVNKNAPRVYKDKKLKINASNLCVTGDTLINILVRENQTTETLELSVRIKDLSYYIKKYRDVSVKSFNIETNQQEYNPITNFAQTGESIDLMEIEDELGNIIKCTPEHKILTRNRGYVEAQYLKEEDILENT